jgi:hypothetical protein
MIIALSIVVGILVAWLLFGSFFSDSGDFWAGVRGFLSGFYYRKQQWVRPPLWQPADSDDGDWIPGSVRLILFLALSAVCGYMTYIGLHKLFG